jgi:hypothetical protein
MVQDTDDAVDDVGEVAAYPALAQQFYGLARRAFPGEAEIGHVGLASPATDGEEPQPQQEHAIEIGVGSAHQLTRTLGDGVEGDRRLDRIVFLEFLIARRPLAIDGTR